MSASWRVPLPRGAEPPYRVFVNGVPQAEGADYDVVGAELHFHKQLEKERLGLGRWTAMFFGLFGSYGKNDSVDVLYERNGKPVVAAKLRFEPVREQDPAARDPHA